MANITYTAFINALDEQENGNNTDLVPVTSSTGTKSIKIADTRPVNDIVDPNLDFWSAGSANITGITTSTYLSDMVKYGKAGAMVEDFSRESSIVPTGSSYAIKTIVTTGDASIAAGDFSIEYTYIEGYNINKYVSNGFFTFAIWVRASKTGTFGISFRNSISDRSYVVEKKIDAIDTYELKICSVPMNFSGGTWDYTNGIGLLITICKAGGSTWQTTAGSWQTGSFLTTSNQTNFVSTIGDDFYIGKMSCGAGQQEIGFDDYDVQKELAKLQRYYEKSYNLTVAPGTITDVGKKSWICPATITDSRYLVDFATHKRTTPTVSAYSPTTGTVNKIYNGTAASDVNATTVFEGESGVLLLVDTVSVTEGNALTAHFIADARF